LVSFFISVILKPRKLELLFYNNNKNYLNTSNVYTKSFYFYIHGPLLLANQYKHIDQWLRLIHTMTNTYHVDTVEHATLNQ
jgi:hypothetical protein